MIEIAIDGMDGSGKSTIIKETKKSLVAEGYTTEIYAPYRLANQRILEDDLYTYWSDGRAGEALNIVQDTIIDCRDRSNADIILYDRHWMTAFTEIHGTEHVNDWYVSMVPTFVMNAPPTTIKARRQSTLDDELTSSDVLLADYSKRYENLVQIYAEHIIGSFETDKIHFDHKVPVDTLVDKIKEMII